MVIDRIDSDWVYRARSPMRLSFGGGGSELSPYVETHGGAVLNATIDRYVYATITAAETLRFYAIDRDLEDAPPATAMPLATEGNAVRLPLHRAVYNRMVKDYNGGRPLALSLQTFCNAPVGSGLGTSSTLTVTIVRCFAELLRVRLSQYELAALAHDIERNDLGLAGGYQDHYTAAFGGFNLMEFHPDGEVVINSLRIDESVLAEFEYSLILYFTGVSRESANIITAQKERLETGEAVESMHRIKALAYRMKDDLLTGKLHRFASVLHDSWQIKRGTAAAVSNRAIDEIYEKTLSAGAIGGKISGAGGGGFLMLFVQPNRQQEVLSVLPDAGTQASFCHFSRQGAMAWIRRPAKGEALS